MKIFRRILSTILAAVLTLMLIPATVFAVSSDWGEPGNLDLNIINGGLMLTDGDDFYYSEGGIYLERGGERMLLSTDNGRNLNLAGGYLYYTLGGEVKRLPAGGGAAESVYSQADNIARLYTIGTNELRFLSGGMAYSYYFDNGQTVLRTSLAGIMNLLPTEYGDIYTTGSVFNYNVYAGDRLVLENVSACYTDSGYLAVNMGTVNYQIALERLFGGFDAGRDLEPFHIHGTVAAAALLSVDEGAHICAECEANAQAYSFTARLMTEQFDAEPGEDDLIPEVSQGQQNIVKRARQLHEIEWTPLADVYQWGYRGVFSAGVTYTGLPYGQPVNTGYVGWTVSFSKYMEAVNDNTSVFYTDYSWYNKIAPYYSTDCSGFVSFAWGMKFRHTTYNIPQDAEKVSDQSIYSLQVGDCLNHQTSHVVLVSDVWYNSEGVVTSVEIMEQTPVITKLTRYGEGGTKTLAALQSYYLGGGYVIYRNADRDSVTYTHDCNVPIDGDFCANCKAAAPKASVTSAVGTKTISLSHKDAGAEIYYTLDGTAPTSNSSRYTGPITVSSTTTLRAIAVTPRFSSSAVLKYTAAVPPVATPTASVTSGAYNGSVVASGSKITLATETSGATLYYTTDGTAPTSSSAKYTGPITLTSDTTIKVMGQANGMKQSETSTFTYKIGKSYTITASAGAGGSITPSGSTTVLETTSQTFTITAGTGYKISDVTVDGASVGVVSSYTFNNISGDHTINAVFAESADLPFSDVTSDAWYRGAVNYVYVNGLFSGTTTSTFSPNSPMTRGMFVTVMGRVSGQSSGLVSGTAIVTGSDVNIRKEPNTSSSVLGTAGKYTAVQVLGTSGEWYHIKLGSITGYIRGDYINAYGWNFKDVSSGQYYAPYVEWAYLSGIVSGTSSNTFAPDNSITREQMCAMLYNYAQKYGITLPTVNAKAAFSDDSSISTYAKAAVYAMQQAGIISGTGNGKFEPQATANRAQVAQIFMNFVEEIS